MWDVFKDWIFDCIAFFANFLGDWGLAIIVITVIFRLLVAPIMHKQIKSTFQMQKVQPLMQEIQKKFADDPVRQNEEMQKLYAETKFNPLAGCVPMLIQMPIFLAMFQTLREIGYSHPDEVYSFYGMVTDLTKTPANVISDGFGAFFPYLVLMLVFALATFFAYGSAEHQERFRTAQPDAYHGWRYDDLHALDFLELARWRSAVLGCVFCYRHSAAAAHHASPEEG